MSSVSARLGAPGIGARVLASTSRSALPQRLSCVKEERIPSSIRMPVPMPMQNDGRASTPTHSACRCSDFVSFVCLFFFLFGIVPSGRSASFLSTGFRTLLLTWFRCCVGARRLCLVVGFYTSAGASNAPTNAPPRPQSSRSKLDPDRLEALVLGSTGLKFDRQNAFSEALACGPYRWHEKRSAIESLDATDVLPQPSDQ